MYPPPLARIDISTRRHQRIAAVSFAEFTLVHVRAGRKQVADAGRAGNVTRGAYLAIAPGQLLHIENRPPDDGRYVAVCLCVKRELLVLFDAFPRARPGDWAVMPATTALDQAFDHAERGLSDGLPESLLQHRVAELLTAVALGGFRPRHARKLTMQERVRMLLAGDPAYAWKADAVARELATSSATMRRHLAREGRCFRDVLLDVRLAHALALIQGTDKPLERVAEACGYASTSHFSRHFRERHGCAPSDLRD